MNKQNKTLNCLVVDDEPLSLEVIEKYAADISFIEITDKASNAISANEILLSEDFDLVFLDINMPKLSGIDFLKSLQQKPMIIFTTAYPEYALEGFELDIVDYLLKPFSFNRFLKACNKALSLHSKQAKEISPDDKILFIKSEKRIHKISQNEIFWIQSAGDYVKIILKEKSIISHDTMKNLQEKLDATSFKRVHKSFIVNQSKIEYIEGNQLKIKGEQIPIGKIFKEKFLTGLGYL